MTHLLDETLASALQGATTEQRADLLLAYLGDKGNSRYDEAVTQLEHGIQSAELAREAGASAEVVVAALLHDLGHLLVSEHRTTGDFLDQDLGHEKVAAGYLAPFLGPAVLEPIRLHVRAKRYLCTVDPTYYDGLSEASKRSYEVQGGLLSDDEKTELDANPHLDQALELRRWDDLAKVSGKESAPLESFRSELLVALGAAEG